LCFGSSLERPSTNLCPKDEVCDIEGEREVRIETEHPRLFVPGNELIESVRIGTYVECCFIRELCGALGTRHGGRQRGTKLAHPLVRERPPATFAYALVGARRYAVPVEVEVRGDGAAGESRRARVTSPHT